MLIVTTPWAKVGEVWRLFTENHTHAVDAVVAHAPTWEMRTDERILAQVAREKTRDPWNYAREFGAEGIGLGRAALRKAAVYANQRIVFDRPIGQNQGVQFPIAEAFIELEAANLLAFKAAALYD